MAVDLFGHRLGPILKKVSRSLYLSLRVLPRGLRTPMALGYLLARAADTITDTRIVAATNRIDGLNFLKQNLHNKFQDPTGWKNFFGVLTGHQAIPEERSLLLELPNLVELFWKLPDADRSDIQVVLGQLISGMEEDLRRPAGEDFGWDKLDRYCHLAAGVVGPFWTRMIFRHVPGLKRRLDQKQMEQWGEEFGKGLQLINVLKDMAQDLRNGRCYLPQEALDQHRLKAGDLLDPENFPRFQPIAQQVIQKSLEYLESGERYLESIPRRHPLLRLSVLWPLWIGLATLKRLQKDTDLLDPKKPHKITRQELKRILLRSVPAIFSNKLLNLYFKNRRSYSGPHQ